MCLLCAVWFVWCITSNSAPCGSESRITCFEGVSGLVGVTGVLEPDALTVNLCN